MKEKSITVVRDLKDDMKHHLHQFILNTHQLLESGTKFTDSICTDLLTKNLEKSLFLSKKLMLLLNNLESQQNEQDNIMIKENNQDELGIFFNLSTHMACIASADGFLKKISSAFIETLGFSEQELLAKPFVEFVYPDDLKATIDIMKSLTLGEPVVRFSNRYICKNGTYKWLEWTARCTTVDGTIYAVAHDISHYKKAKEQLSIFVSLYNNFGQQDLTDHMNIDSEQNFIARVTDNVMTHIADSKFDVSALAESLFMSRSTLQRKIKFESGMTAALFIRQIKLTKAHDYIMKNRHKTFAETAYAVGFNHVGHFSKLYKNYLLEITSHDK
jgi:PAS domain S-box-containing protein